MTKRTSKPVRLVGQGMPRVDAGGKVRGTTRYLNDIDYQGVLQGVVVRAPVPRGILKAVEPDPAFNWKGVVVATAQGDVRLPRRAFFVAAQGLTTSFTAEQFAAAIAEATSGSDAQAGATADTGGAANAEAAAKPAG